LPYRVSLWRNSMPGIMQHITNSDSEDHDANLASLDEWSEEIATKLAKEETIHLTSEHLKVLTKLREFYRDRGPWKNPRTILKYMQATVGDEESRKTLYKLFPDGPVRQACKLAGLPIPANSAQPSFGSVH